VPLSHLTLFFFSSILDGRVFIWRRQVFATRVNQPSLLLFQYKDSLFQFMVLRVVVFG
jgi:hypothetical protein